MLSPRNGLVASIAILLAATAPALANWEGTEWGMSPTAALAALEGATSHIPTEAEQYDYDGSRYSPLVKQSRSIEGVAGEVTLLFDADDSLKFVVFNPDDTAQCDALGDALLERYGSAEPTGFGTTEIYNWEDNGDIVRFTNSPDAGFCNLNYSAS
ncbi:hypothetical protein [Devosia sp. SD17-2]|uniref:hypothetical protein n=1 Tax=Devosia sp. SD17-2 TaxID=2976459 RepID=UPI0023D8319C|nr:hypothetical protein [Devosia sp. SD17-2]WEJ34110.1 hypothetical protein NYQ88_04715 [Devosia sp. SD17-2]